MEEFQMELLERLASGVDPSTGEAFGAGSPYQRPEVIRALYAALEELRQRPRTERDPNRPARAGQPWTEEEEQRLLEQFDAGDKEPEIARKLNRTPGAITARLVKLGRIDAPPNFRFTESAA